MIVDTFALARCEVDMGVKLCATFLAAKLPVPHMIATARIEGGPKSSVYDHTAGALRSLLPMAEPLGIMLPPLVGGWTRTPRRVDGRRKEMDGEFQFG
jgi:hypothetical protein